MFKGTKVSEQAASLHRIAPSGGQYMSTPKDYTPKVEKGRREWPL